ncbi:MAG: response regulator [Bacteroidetes bacterium]|nr:response regulator [Bacteroidota bacterium]
MKNLKRILLAEDNPNDGELTLAALSEINLSDHIDMVKDGEEVLEYLCYKGKYTHREKVHPAVILMDIKMPRLNGIEALQMIRNHPDLKLIPIVMLSSSREEIDLIKCYEQNVNAYVVKPVDVKEFFEVVKLIGMFWALINELPF